MSSPIRVLCVDDEPMILDGLKRTLRPECSVSTASNGAEALEILRRDTNFDVILSDLRMPGMDGAEFLHQARQFAPDASRILLTGHADLESAIEVINQGRVFRFLTKPTTREVLFTAVRDGAELRSLRQVERLMLEHTLRGAVKALSDLLMLTSPVAFGRATRVRERVMELAEAARVVDRWQVDVACTLAWVGLVAVPDDAVTRWLAGQASAADLGLIDKVPQMSADAIAGIPRLEQVRITIARQTHRMDASRPEDPPPWGSRALKIAQDFQAWMAKKVSPTQALTSMRGDRGAYDRELLELFAGKIGASAPAQVQATKIDDLRVNMTLAENLYGSSGVLVLAEGSVLTPVLLQRIANLHDRVGLREPVKVIVRD